ncbi:MAG TPA: PRC-barrel domain-containing protein [Myxococcaceae bacterium]|jgi:hypothetical protein
MDARTNVTTGMTVYSQDGAKLGKVVSVDEAGLFVEKGLLFPRELGFSWEDVADVQGDGVHLRLDHEAVKTTLRGTQEQTAAPRPAPEPGVPPVATTPGGPETRTGNPPARVVKGLTIPMVGEGIAPMLVEEEVVVVEREAVAGADRRASPDDPEKPRTAPGTGRTDPGGSHE